MSARRRSQAAFSLAVLNGLDRGKVLRTGRSRIVVGADAGCDLVLRDPGVSPRHFQVVIDKGSWRADAPKSDQSFMIDRRWTHPETGAPGAIIFVGPIEILAFPDDLEDSTIQEELRARPRTESDPDSAVITDVGDRPAELDRALGRSADPNEAPTMALDALRAEDLDPKTIASLPTQAKAVVPPEVLRNRGRPSSDFAAERTSIVKAEEKAEKPKKSAWGSRDSKRRRGDRGSSDAVPEILAEPESQMARVPGSERSVMGVSPLAQDDIAIPTMAHDPSPSPKKSSGSSAWDSSGVRSKKTKKSAWGDDRKNAIARVKKPEEEPPAQKKSAWGDGPRRPRASVTPPAPSAPYSPSTPMGARGAGPIATRGAGPIDGGEGLKLPLSNLLHRVGEPGLAILQQPDGNYATAARVMTTKLQDLFRTYGYRAFMISSSEPLTGKTTAACNLAFALAEDTNRRVALVEANFRYPRMSEILGVPEDLGLIPVLEGRRSAQESNVRIEGRNLVIFPAGGRHTHPAQLLASPRFKTLLSDLASTVDIALIDAPSIRPSADTNLLLSVVDGVLLVALNGATSSRSVDLAADQLGRERVLGAMFNHVPGKVAKALRGERRDRFKSA